MIPNSVVRANFGKVGDRVARLWLYSGRHWAERCRSASKRQVVGDFDPHHLRANGVKLESEYLAASFRSNLLFGFLLIRISPIYRADPKTITNKLLVGYQGW